MRRPLPIGPRGPRIALLALMLFAPGFSSARAETEAGDHQFQRSIKPLLARHCQSCHDSKSRKADLALDSLNPDLVGGNDAERWRIVLERVKLGEMPPDDADPLPAEGRKQLVEWLSAQLATAEKIHPGSSLPSHGNRVDHESLFRCPPDEELVAATPSRIWRLSPHLYQEFLNQSAKNTPGVSQPFSGASEPGIKDFASLFSVDEPTTAQLIRNAQAIVGKQTHFTFEDGKLKGKNGTVREFEPLFHPESKPPAVQIEAAITQQFKNVLKRKPETDELQRFVSLYEKNVADAGQAEGARTTLAAVMLLPEAVFRLELGEGRSDEHGRRMLSPREIAFAISYALTDRPPDQPLLDAAEKGKLGSRVEVAYQVQRILADRQIQKPRILRFFREYFGYDAAPEVFKDDKEFKYHEPRILVSDTDQLVQYILDRDRDVLKELLTTNKSFVNYAIDNKTKQPKRVQKDKPVHESYNLDAWPERQPVELPPDERAGILTQPSWLVAHSLNTENHAIRRGKWVRERLLGGTVPDLPITVDAQLPEDPDRTLRERMEITRQDFCWSCHQKMNPLGLPFESYDHFGRHRTTELDQPVDASGSVSRSGSAELDGEVTDAVAMIHRLAGSERVRQVFVRHAFRYWMGRNETLADGCTLVAADQAYVESNGSFRALVVSLLTSDSFLMRTADEEGRTEAAQN